MGLAAGGSPGRYIEAYRGILFSKLTNIYSGGIGLPDRSGGVGIQIWEGIIGEGDNILREIDFLELEIVMITDGLSAVWERRTYATRPDSPSPTPPTPSLGLLNPNPNPGFFELPTSDSSPNIALATQEHVSKREGKPGGEGDHGC
eukprot:508505-Amorphochlora_amoeboformis.AAC.1